MTAPTLRRRLALLGALALLAAPTLGGCPICNSVSQVLDDFEDDCGAIPCAWTVETGTVERAATFHEAEHGMRLVSESVATRRVSYGTTLPPESMQVIARCDAGALMRVSLEGSGTTFGDGGAGTTPGAVRLDVATSGENLYQVYEQSFSWPSGATVTSLRVEVLGTGSCTLDDVIVTSQPAC